MQQKRKTAAEYDFSGFSPRAARRLGFADAVAISGIDTRQLRNGIDRGVLRVGEKLRVGRWAFNLSDCFYLLIVQRLTARTWVPLSQAADLAAAISPFLEELAHEVVALGSIAKDNIADDPRLNSKDTQFVIFSNGTDYEIIVHKRGEGWGYYNLDGSRTETKIVLDAHVRLPGVGLVVEFIQRSTLVLSEHVASGEGALSCAS